RLRSALKIASTLAPPEIIRLVVLAQSIVGRDPLRTAAVRGPRDAGVRGSALVARSARRSPLRRRGVGRRIFRAQALPTLDLLLLRLDHLCRDVEERRTQRAGLDVAGHGDRELGGGLAPRQVHGARRSGE